MPTASKHSQSPSSPSAPRKDWLGTVTSDSGYAVNQTDDRSTAARGSGEANGLAHMVCWPASCRARVRASPSIDCSTNQPT